MLLRRGCLVVDVDGCLVVDFDRCLVVDLCLLVEVAGRLVVNVYMTDLLFSIFCFWLNTSVCGIKS